MHITQKIQICLPKYVKAEYPPPPARESDNKILARAIIGDTETPLSPIMVLDVTECSKIS